MKIGMLVPGGVDRSGTERVIPILLAMIERVAREHELHVFSLAQEPRPATWPLLGATVHNAGTRAPRLRAFRDVLAEHRRGRFDLLHGVWARPGVVASAAGRALRRPVLLHLVGGDVAAVPEIGYGMQRSLRGRLQVRFATSLSSHVTANSGYAVRLAAARGVTAERVAWGVSLAEWPPAPPRRRHPEAVARLLFVASLNRVKDPFTLLRGAAALRDRGVRFTLDVIGFDTLGGAVQRLASQLELEGVVQFRGVLPQAELRPWMLAADLLLITSRHECGPIVSLEAALCGVPTVGTRVGHLADWAPEAAVPIPMHHPGALADAVQALLLNEEHRLAVAAAAQRRALEDDADRAARRVLELYQTLTDPTECP
jgi:glycosyltransferase involved in cell wall biosynthesis